MYEHRRGQSLKVHMFFKNIVVQETNIVVEGCARGKLFHSMTDIARSCDIIDNVSMHYYHVYQVRSYLYAKYAAAYTLSQKGTFYDVTICNKIDALVDLQQVSSNRTKLINLKSYDGCDCSISWHYSVNTAEQHR